MRAVNRRVGGLEAHLHNENAEAIVNRRVGGLEDACQKVLA